MEAEIYSEPARREWREQAGRFLAWNEPRPALHTDLTVTPVVEMGAAVEEWVRLSNGRIEAVAVAGDGLPGAPMTFADLLALPLGCLEGFGPANRYQFLPVSASRALLVLHRAASLPCAYGPGSSPDLARLKTWISLAALAGADPGAAFARVSALVAETAWYWFAADTEWFYGQDWGGLGLVALRAGHRSVGVLAAVDTD